MGFYLGNLWIGYYGIMIASALLIGLILCDVLCRKKGFDNNIPYVLVLIIVPLAILGARLYYIIFSDQLTLADFFDFSHGGFRGLAIYGGIIGGLLGVIIYACIKKCSLVTLTDLIAPALILGQSIGRWGNFFNQEAYGIAVNFDCFPITVFIDNGLDYGPHLATFFYESILNLIGFIVVLLVYLRQKKYGTATATYLIWYGVVRMIIEPLRTDSLLIVPGNDFVFNRISFVISIAIVVLGVVLLYQNKKGKISQNDQNLCKRNLK